MEKKYDVVVIGAGHSGCEAALSAARMGCKTLLLTVSIEHIALMPCNPSIGGPAKGQIVREIDALGGEMARNADKSSIQTRRLNTGKGPAVQTFRAQCDKDKYHQNMLHALNEQSNLDVKQAIVTNLNVENNMVTGVSTHTGISYACTAVVVNTGTYLESKVIVGYSAYPGGPAGQVGAYGLTASLKKAGIEIGRFKTGTPARVDGRTLDYSKMTIQPGDDPHPTFSFDAMMNDLPQLPCWLTYTNAQTHAVVRENISKSPLYAGLIQGRGPRYCPCIEDKVMRYSHKERHQVFLEPMGLDTIEYYVGGLSTSMPEEVQLAFLRTIHGMENVEIVRPGYSVEYDIILPQQIDRSLAVTKVKGLYSAGQTNGTSGYEEAAAQGLIAGINAARYVQNKASVVLGRAQAYIGVLIDDLVTKGTEEPYRMLTSRAEHRLLLRNDNAQFRLSELGYNIGLLDERRYAAYQDKKTLVAEEMARLQTVVVKPSLNVDTLLKEKGGVDMKTASKALDFLRRPEVDYHMICALTGEGLIGDDAEASAYIEAEIKYNGYIRKQEDLASKMNRMDEKVLPGDIDYPSLRGMCLEAREKLSRLRPATVGQAMRISGVSPADINALLIHMEYLYRANRDNEVTKQNG